MSILIFLKPPYSTGDKTGTKKSIQSPHISISQSRGIEKRWEILWERCHMTDCARDENDAYKFSSAPKQLLPIFSHKMS